MEPKPIAAINNLSVCIVVSNLDETAKWYRDVLGFKVAKALDTPELSMRIAFLELNGIILELVEMGNFIPDKRPDPPEYLNKQGVSQLSFRVDNLEAVLQLVKSRNLELTWDIVTNEKLKMKAFLMRDNEGNLIEFIEDFK